MKRKTDVEVELVKGGLLELSVQVDGKKILDTNRLWYPLPSSLVKGTLEFLKK